MMKTWITGMLMTIAVGNAGSAVTPFTFAHISDTHMAVRQTKFDENLKNILKEISATTPQPAFVLHTGDITEMGSVDEFNLYKENIKASAVPVYSTPGNHESRWADQSINRFAEMLGKPNISFVKNGVRFIGWNSAIWLEHHGAISGDTRRWIVGELKKDPPGTPAVLFTHQPPMYPDSTYQTGDVELWRDIAPYNVVLFANGHGHIFKNWIVNGVVCHMTKGAMNENGGYTLYEFTDSEMKVYDKLYGQDKKLVASIPLKRSPIGVTLKPVGAVADRTFEVRVTNTNGRVSKVEYAIDHHQRPGDSNWHAITAASAGTYRFTLPEAELVPGRHTLAVRAVEPDGSIWVNVIDLPVAQGKNPVRVFDAVTALQGPCAVDATSVYVGGWDGKLYSVDKAAMKKKWTFATRGAVIGAPAVSGSLVVFGSTDRSVYAVDTKTGKKVWAFPTTGPIQGHTAVSGGRVFVASGDHNLYCLDLKTGKKLWAYPMKMHAQARPAVVDGVVFVGAWDNTFYAINASTGTLNWSKRIGTSIFFSPAVSSPCVVDGKFITPAAIVPADKAAFHVLALDTETGETVWGHRMEEGSAAYASPTSDGRRVYLANLSGDLFALNLNDGSLAWKTKMGETTYDCRPTYSDGIVVCNNLFGGLRAYNAANGEPVFQYKTGAGLQFAWPTVDGRTIYQPSMDGTLTSVSGVSLTGTGEAG
jgi:outer membrane protein assembly factor BamB